MAIHFVESRLPYQNPLLKSRGAFAHLSEPSISRYKKSENCVCYFWLRLTCAAPILLLSINSKTAEIKKNQKTNNYSPRLALAETLGDCQQDPKYHSSVSTRPATRRWNSQQKQKESLLASPRKEQTDINVCLFVVQKTTRSFLRTLSQKLSKRLALYLFLNTLV